MKTIEYDEAALDVLTSVAESLVTTGMYESPQEAVKGLALMQIERDQ